MKTRTFVFRHLSRDKSNTTDPQTPTMMGLIEAFVMGLILAKDFGARFVNAVSSPQPRAIRTARVMLRAFLPLDQGDSPVGDGAHLPMVRVSTGLDDFSSDPRFASLKGDLKKVKGDTDVESEQAIFLAGGALEMLRIAKLNEAIMAINDLRGSSGDSLVTLHGATIDGLYAHYARMLNPDTPDGMLAFGRMIGKCEGFVLSYGEDGALNSIRKIERPAWLNVLAVLLGGGSD